MKHDRKMHPRSGSTECGRPKRSMTVQQALEWAFRVEHAQLELPESPDLELGHGFGFGLEYLLIQRAALGCKVDGGQHKIGSYTHEDAEVIAATVVNLPDSLGGKRMAIRVAELARSGLTPDWMPGAVQRCVPVDIKRNKHGDRAVSVVVGTERVLVSGKWRSVELRACPVTYRPDARQIGAARGAYGAWWQALGWIGEGLIAGGMLRAVEISAGMPKVTPWRTL